MLQEPVHDLDRVGGRAETTNRVKYTTKRTRLCYSPAHETALAPSLVRYPELVRVRLCGHWAHHAEYVECSCSCACARTCPDSSRSFTSPECVVQSAAQDQKAPKNQQCNWSHLWIIQWVLTHWVATERAPAIWRTISIWPAILRVNVPRKVLVLDGYGIIHGPVATIQQNGHSPENAPCPSLHFI